MSDVVWSILSEKKRNSLTCKVNRLARKFARINYSKPAHAKIITKIKFTMCRFIQKQILKKGVESTDCAYWQANGWLGKSRPWKR